jgi:hypothetical protein
MRKGAGTVRLLGALAALVLLSACVAVREVEYVPICEYAWARFNDPFLEDPIERWRLYELLERNNCPR